MPNTCAAPPIEPICNTNNLRGNYSEQVIVGHIGQLGPDHYYLELVELIRRCRALPISFLVIGGIAPAVEEALRSVESPKLTLLGHISHERLGEFYQKMDYGLILYKGIDLNFEYCAPNKLYEYWSHGIKVIAHPLAGLQRVFSDPIQGRLVELETSNAVETIVNILLNRNLDKVELRSLFQASLGIEHYLPELKRRLVALQTS